MIGVCEVVGSAVTSCGHIAREDDENLAVMRGSYPICTVLIRGIAVYDFSTIAWSG